MCFCLSVSVPSVMKVRCRDTLWERMQQEQDNIENLLCEALIEGKILLDSAGNIGIKTLCFDCRGMGEPRETESRNHLGTHPASLEMYAGTSQMKEHLERLRAELELCTSRGITSVRLLVFDKHGRWAAMAVGKAFAEVALRSQGLTLTNVSFLTNYLESDCRGCDACSFWSRSYMISNNAVKNMWQLYEGSPLA